MVDGECLRSGRTVVLAAPHAQAVPCEQFKPSELVVGSRVFGRGPRAGRVLADGRVVRPLDYQDPVKLAAIFDAARHHALRVETAQQARCDASKAVAGAADWAELADGVRNRQAFYAAKPWLKRAVS